MTLFDPDVYGPATKKRERKERPEEIRLNKPWVLVRQHKGPPMAHLVQEVVRSKLTKRDKEAAKNGAVRTMCGKFGQPMEVEGHPMAFVCHTCWDLNRFGN